MGLLFRYSITKRQYWRRYNSEMSTAVRMLILFNLRYGKYIEIIIIIFFFLSLHIY